MENVLMIMTLLCLLSGVLRNSLLPGRGYPAAFALIGALFVFFSQSYAIEINKLSVSQALENLEVTQNLNILVSLHFLLVLGVASSLFRKSFGLPRNRFYRFLEYIPALMVFPALFYLYLMLLFSFVGTPFSRIGLVFSLVVLLFMGGGGYGLRVVFPETELRTTLMLVVELLLFVLMVCSTVFHPSAMMFNSQSSVDWNSLWWMLGVVVVLFIVGFFRLDRKLVSLWKR